MHLFESILITATGLTERIFKEFERIDVTEFFMSKIFEERYGYRLRTSAEIVSSAFKTL
jgi:hypothetical protein